MIDFGLLVVDKPVGPTSHAVVNAVRKGTGIRKVGHAGTLDPRASGVLVLCLGPATRLSEYLSIASKRYEATALFGYATETYDAEGEATFRSGETPSLAAVEGALADYRGEIHQVPPPYSAIKLGGRKAYELARAGADLELEPRQVTIYRLEILRYEPPELGLDIECSAGTYIRSLAHDLGQAVSTGAHLAALRRTKSGPFGLDQAVPLSDLEGAFQTHSWDRYVVAAADALPELAEVRVSREDLEQIRHGRRIPAAGEGDGLAKAIGPDGSLVAILESVDDGAGWHPRKVFLS